MAKTAVEPVFVDTSVLIDAKISTRVFHVAALEKLRELRANRVDLWISRQILREYAAVLSRPQVFSNPLPLPDLIADIVYFQSQFQIAEDGPGVTAHLNDLLNSIPMGGNQIQDANVVATMQANSLNGLLTAHAADYQRFGALISLLAFP